MFNNIYGSDFSSVFSPKLLAFAVIGVFTIYFLSIGFTLLVEKVKLQPWCDDSGDLPQ